MGFQGPVQWPFGAGMSYTSFSFKWSQSALATQQSQHVFKSLTESIDHSVVVTNTGKRSGDVVVTAFANAAGDDAPYRRLIGFERLHDMKPSESRTVFFSTSPETLAFADSMGRRILAPGRMAVEVGDSSSAARHNFDIVLDDNSPWI